MSALDRLRRARQAQQLGRAASLGIGAYQGATFNFGDELAGFGAALIPGGKGYEEGRDAVRSAYARARPGYRLAGELAGSLAVPVGGAGFIARGATAVDKARRAAQIGAAQGAVAGAGAGDGGAGERTLSALEGAAVGGLLGGAAQATLGRLSRARARQASPGAAEAQARGIRLTRGQQTGDVEQLSREQELLGVRGAGGDTLRHYLEGQRQDIARAVDQTGERLGVGGDVAGSARDLVGNLRGAERAAGRAVDEAYGAVRSSRGSIAPEGAAEAATDLARRFQRTIHDDVSGIGLNPETGDYLQKVAGRLIERSGLADAASGSTRRRPTIQRIEGLRQGLNRAVRHESDAQRRLGLQRMVGDFDDWLQGTVTRGLMRGDDDLVDRLQNARGLARHYHSIFGTGGRTTNDRAADRIIQGLVDEQAGPDEAIRFIQRINQTGGSGTPQALTRIQEASPEAYEMLRTAHFQNMLVNPKTGNELTPNRIASNLDHLVERQPEMARSLYGTEGVADIRGLSSAIKSTDQQLARTGNVSRSGFTVANLTRRFGRLAGLATGIIGGNPQVAFTTLLTEGMANVESLAQAAKATRPVPMQSPLPAIVRQGVANVGRVAPGVTGDPDPPPQDPIEAMLADPSKADPQTMQVLALAEIAKSLRGQQAPVDQQAAAMSPEDQERLASLEQQRSSMAEQIAALQEAVQLSGSQTEAMTAVAEEQQALMQRQGDALAEAAAVEQALPDPKQTKGKAWTRKSATPERDDQGRIVAVSIIEVDENGKERTRRAVVNRDEFGRMIDLKMV